MSQHPPTGRRTYRLQDLLARILVDNDLADLVPEFDVGRLPPGPVIAPDLAKAPG